MPLLMNTKLRTCSETEFKCENSKCVPVRWLCDNEDDCGDKSDEHPRQCQNKTCAPDQFNCGSTSGLCIPITWRCDGQEDCADGLDEKDECPNVTCSASEFMCVNGKCIPDRWRCDGDVDCLDGSDEATCPKQTLRSTCSSTEFMCKSRDCIHLDWVCDGEADCPDRSDEQNCTASCRIVNECNVNNGGCSQKCVDDVIGYHCDCFSGYQLLDNQTCEDINECEIYGTCSQLCNNTKGSFKCSCLEGYSIEPSNHRRCKAQQGHTALLFSNRRDLRKINLETSEYTLVASGLRSAVAIDYDYGKKTIVWTDVLEGRVYRWMFWADWGNVKIERAGMDGTHRSVIVSKNIQWPNGLALDLVSRKIFWADAKLHIISCANFDGSDQHVVLSSPTEVKHPFSLDVFEVSPNHCGDMNGGCSHMCLPAPHITEGSAKYTCACPNGMVLSDNGLNCLSLDINRNIPF
ncbi:UNVERIFIED_CONTAM: Vldlr [Trichonephila clavipes]